MENSIYIPQPNVCISQYNFNILFYLTILAKLFSYKI